MRGYEKSFYKTRLSFLLKMMNCGKDIIESSIMSAILLKRYLIVNQFTLKKSKN